MYQAVKVVPRMAMKEKMRMLRKDGMKVVDSPTLPNSSAYSLQAAIGIALYFVEI